jgi:hypothetical protein
MTNRGNPPPGGRRADDKVPAAAWIFFAVVVLLVLGMVGSLYYPFPAGPLDVASFIALWLREIVLLLAVFGGLLFAFALWLRRKVKRRFSGHHHEP